MTDIDSVGENRVEQRAEGTCPNCGGTALEPRSGDVWLCSQCARRLDADEVEQ